jgi:putative GTP pyrophosphokinase
MHESRAKYRLKNKDDDRYNYITHPKKSGYRGVHDVYEYCVSSIKGVKWNGLLIEIQYRTIFQHAWATAVEVADLITYNRIKFSESDPDHRRFFQLASEIIARSCERRHGYLPELRNHEVISEFEHLDRKLGLMIAFENLRQSQQKFPLKMNTLLIFRMGSHEADEDLEIETYDSVNKAIERYEQLEKTNPGNLDIVLVRADTSESVRDAFRNYFSDAHDFVRYIKEGCQSLASNPDGFVRRAA